MFSSLKGKLLGFTERVAAAAEATKDQASALVAGEVILDAERLDAVSWDLQLQLLESDVALEASERILKGVREGLLGGRFKRGEVGEEVKRALGGAIRGIFPPTPDLAGLVRAKSPKPFVIAFVGVNGSGKTTTIAKVAHLLQREGLNCILAAGDTFRAGAIEQLEKHAGSLGVRLIKHAKGADPAAVAFDAIEHAKARGKDAVLIDTAGRMETNVNLMDEMRKVVRVARPDMTIFVGDAMTGNAAVEQAENFSKAVAIDGIILAKADADAKGGSAITIAHVMGRPILFLGVGQGYGDLRPFDADWLLGQVLG
ncbi:MAG: signal recognition particle-docking protein FtsY [Candidatus Hydrothermarchaeota archaeon]